MEGMAKLIRLSIAAALSLLVTACGGSGETQAPAPVPVDTVTIIPHEIPNVIELPGRVAPVRVAEVRARVTGIVERRLYKEGAAVSAGQPLFQINPSELRASYAQTQASLERAKATAANARAVVERYRPLVAENAISGQEFDAAIAASREASANVAQIRAQLDAASLQLGYTTVRAPISGRAGPAQVTEGALVSQGEGTLMARVEQISPVYVVFSQSASELLNIRKSIADGSLEMKKGQLVEVRLTLANGSEYAVPGYIDLIDFSVDETTGTVALRAEFPNPDRQLLTGEFVRAKIYAGKVPSGIAVPQRAVTVGESGSSVFVVDGEGKAAVRPIETGALVNGMWIIEKGLKAGDVVITSNLLKLRPGVPVKSTARSKPAANAPKQAPAKTQAR
jgi:membrane fusion protein (multidrug efflux system)